MLQNLIPIRTLLGKWKLATGMYEAINQSRDVAFGFDLMKLSLKTHFCAHFNNHMTSHVTHKITA